MKAAVIERFEAPLVIRDVKTPEIGPQEVLVRVRASSLCRTDLKIISGLRKNVVLPHIPGHEIAGAVSAVGDEVKGVRPGDRVVVYTKITCGHCRFCLAGRESMCDNLIATIGMNMDGGMAEFVKAPGTHVLPIGDSISFAGGATLPDAAGTSYHALSTRAGVKEGDVVVVLGVGGVGLHAVQVAKALGARVYAVDVDEGHLEKAAEVGSDMALHPGRDNVLEILQRQSERGGADVVMDLVARPETFEQSVEWACRGGKFLVVGYDLTPHQVLFASSQMVRKELEILGCAAMDRQDVLDVIRLAEEKKITPVVDEVLSLTEINRAYDRLRQGKVVGRLVMEP